MRRALEHQTRSLACDLQLASAAVSAASLDSASSHTGRAKEVHRVRVQTRVRFQRRGFRSPIRARTPKSESKGEPDFLWTRESESKEESDLPLDSRGAGLLMRLTWVGLLISFIALLGT
jgi:hypothetical protein